MIKILKKFLFIIFAFTFLFISITFVTAKFFPAEFYLVKSKLFSSGKNFNTFKIVEVSCENADIKDLIEEGSVLNDSLMLINEKYIIPNDYEPKLTDLGGVFINSSAEAAYRDIKNAIKENFNNSLYIMSAYRSAEEQIEIKKSKGEYAAFENSSEHLSGLAIDVYVKYHAGMGFLDCDEGQFVNSFCQNYGFIIRYPYYGEDITGIPYEPWHIRYVGLPHSIIIANSKITLEKYIESLIPGNFYSYENYIISRQPIDESIMIPENAFEITISPDNTGYYIVTAKIPS